MTGVLAAAGLAARRLRATPGRWLAVSAVVAVAVCLLGALGAAGVVAGDHAARRTLAAVPAAQRTAVLTWGGGAGAGTDAAARRALAGMRGGTVRRGIVLLPTNLGRVVARVGAIAPAAGAVALRSGRLPRGACRPARCEVVQVAGPAVPDAWLQGRGIRFVVVGRGLVTDPTAIGFATTRRDVTATGAAGRAPLLVAGDPAGVEALGGLDSVFRTQMWSARLPLTALHSWQLGDEIGRIAAIRARLDRTAGGFTLSSPQALVQAAQARARRAPGRLTAAGATAAAALAALLVLAAGALRTGLLAEDARLRRGGASAPQRALLVLCETGAPVAAGLLAGLGLAALAAALRARAGGVAAGHVLAGAFGGALARGGAAALVAWLLVLVSAWAPGRLVRVLVGGAATAAVALLAGLLAPRGGSADPLPAAVIPVAAAAGGLLLGLALPVALRAAVRLAPERRPLARIGLLELAREPSAATVAAAGLAVSVAIAGFAFAYRATLDRSRTDQADHRVPLAATVVPGTNLGSPLAAAPAAAWRRLPGVAAVAPVLRGEAFAITGPTRNPVEAVGVPAATLAGLRAWRAADRQGDRAALARRLVAAPFGGPAAGFSLPVTARSVDVTASTAGDRVALTLVVRTPSGLVDRVALGVTAASPAPLRAPLPASALGGTVLGLLVEPGAGQLITTTHQLAEGGAGAAAAGTLRLGPLRAGGAVFGLGRWRAAGGLRRHGALLRYRITGSATLRAAQPIDRAPLPVLADAATAHDAAITRGMTLEVEGVPVLARVVGLVRRFPTVASGSRLVLADAGALSGALDAQQPGAGDPRELWLAARPGQASRLDAAVAGAARRHGLRVLTNDAARRAIAGEPVAREVLGALTATALLAAALALAGVAIALRRALRDASASLADLEAQGLGPRALRRALRLRAAAIAVAGVVPGVVLALALTALVTGAVRAGATGPPDPPLVAVVPWGSGALAAIVLLLAAAAAGALAVAFSLREPLPSTELPAEAA